MSSQALSTGSVVRGVAVRMLIGISVTAVLATVFAVTQPASHVSLPAAHLHAPRWDLIARASAPMRIHLATVLAALVLATVQVVGPKGRTLHRVLGWVLAILLLITAVASLFIRNPAGGLFNPFQVFSIWTLIGVPWALVAARRHDIRRHARLMYGFYFGALIFAGLLTLLPGRLMWWVFFG